MVKDTDSQLNCFNYIHNKKEALNFIAWLFKQKLEEKNGSIIIPMSWMAPTSFTKTPERWLLEILTLISFPFTVIIEDYHVDRIYRDSYYMYFSNQHFELKRFCKRLSFFKGEILEEMFFSPEHHAEVKQNFIGSCVIKPHHDGAIGRTLINPNLFSDLNGGSSYQLLSNFSIDVMGIQFTVCTFPYSMQDTETTSCADITLLNIMEYFSNKYSDYRFLYPSDIISIVKEQSFERALPTRGLKFTQLTRVLTRSGFSPRLYFDEAIKNTGVTLKQIWHYYIESGIPVALGLGSKHCRLGHSIIGIGHSKNRRDLNVATLRHHKGLNYIDSSDLYDDYVIMDDNQLPFSIRNFEDISIHDLTPNAIAIPLAKRMFMEAADAYKVSLNILTSQALGINRVIKEKDNTNYKQIGRVREPFVIRLFLTSARSYKKHKMNCTDSPISLKKIYCNLPLPRFVWVFEIYTKESYKNNLTIGEIVLDATSSGKSDVDCAVSILYLGRLGIRLPGQGIEKITDGLEHWNIKGWHPIQGFYGNLSLT